MSSAPVPGCGGDPHRRREQPRAEHVDQGVARGIVGSPTIATSSGGRTSALERLEQVRERGGVLAQHRRQRARPSARRVRPPSASPVSAARRSSAVGGERVLRRRRVVLDSPSAARSAPRRRAPVVKKPPSLVVGEEREQLVGDGARLGEPRDVVELGQREERLEQRGVVLGVREQVGAPVLPRTEEAAVVAAQLARGGSARWCAPRPSSRRGRARPRPR